MRKIGFALLALFCTGAAAPPSGWGQDGYGPGQNRYNPAESVINAGTIAKLKPRWTVTTAAGEPGCEPSPRAPLAVDGRVFLLDGHGVSAYAATTGRRLWHNDGFSAIHANLIVAGGLVLVTDTSCFSNSDYDGFVTALDAATGTRRWRATGSWMIDTVVADADTLVTSGYCGTCDGFEHGVIAYRIIDGTKLWTHENEVLAGPVSAAARILLRRGTKTTAARITTGTPLWTRPRTPSDTAARRSAVVAARSAVAATPAGDRFYLDGDAGLTAVDAASGRRLWQVPRETGDLAADGRRVYVASTARVNTYDAETGRLLWTRALPSPRTPVRAGGLLHVIHGPGTLAVLSPATGTPIPSGIVHTGLTGHVVPAGGRLFTIREKTVRAYTP